MTIVERMVKVARSAIDFPSEERLDVGFRAALRAVRPGDVSEAQVKTMLTALGLGFVGPNQDGVERFYGKFVCADPIETGRRAIAAAISKGAE